MRRSGHARALRRLRLAVTPTILAIAVAAALPAAATAAPTCVANGLNTRMECTFSTVGADTFTIPDGVTRVWITAVGGGGGGGQPRSETVSSWTGRGGNGATVTVADVPVLPSPDWTTNRLSVYVGGSGASGGANAAGGGGGATKVWGTTSWSASGRPYRQTDITIVAGGGGGGGSMGGAGGHGGARADGKGGDGMIAGYEGRCSGGGGGGATSAGGTGFADGAGVSFCFNGRAGYAGAGGSAQAGAAGGAGPDGTSGGGAQGRTGNLSGSVATGGGGGGGWGGGAGGYLGAGGGAGGSTVMSDISLAGVTTSYSSDAGNGGVGGTGGTAAGAGWVRISYPLQTQTITLTSAAATSSNWRVGRTYTLQATGGASGNPIVWTLEDGSGCTLDGNVLTFTRYSYCRVAATQAGTADYREGELFVQSSNSNGIVFPGTQAITFTSSASGHAVDGSYAPTATGGGSGNPVTFSLTAGSSGVCTISGGVVAFQHVGTCTVLADQAASPLTSYDYLAAPQVQQAITVAKGSQAIAFTTAAPSPVFGDGSTYTPATSGGNSGLARVLAIDGTSSGVCSISGGVVTFQHAGTCLINADQAGTDDYDPAPRVQQSITVAKAAQAVAFTSSAPSPVFGDGSSYTPVASGGGSGNARVFSIAAGSGGVCSISGGVVTFQHAGTCVVNADQSGTADYDPAPRVQQAIEVARAAQAVAFTSTPSSTKVDDTYSPTASGGGSGNARVFSIAAGSGGVCSISGGVVTFDHVGTCVVNADQAGTGDYDPAPRVQQSITVAKADQAVAFTSAAPSPVFGDASSYAPTASGGASGNARVFTIAAGSSGVCSISGGVVTFQHAGECVVHADQAGTDDYHAAPRVQQSITVAKADQAISFTTQPTAPKVDGSYAPLTTGGGSGLARVLAIDASSGAVCTISAGVVSFHHVGTCVVNADQAGTGDYNPAPRVQQAITVAKADQAIAFTSTPTAPKVDGTYSPTTTGGGSGLLRILTIDAGSSGVCSISAGVVAFEHAGTCVVNADQPGTDDYHAAPRVQQSIEVARADQLVAFTSAAPSPVHGDGTAYAPTAGGGASGNPVAFAVASDPAGTCAIDGSGEVTFPRAGTCTITATQAGTADYLEGAATQTITVARAAQTVAFTSTAPTGAVAGGEAYRPAADGSPGGTPIAFEASGACELRDGAVAPLRAGTCVVRAARAVSRDFLAVAATQTYEVAPPPGPPATAQVPATPSAAGTVAVESATVSWPTKAFAQPVTVNVAPAPSGGMAFAAGSTPVRLEIVGADGRPVTSFNAPLELVLAAGTTTGTPGYSRDGRTWTAIPRIAGPGLPAGYRDGWYPAADGTIRILTLHATDFGVLAKGARVAAALRVTGLTTQRRSGGSMLAVRIRTSLPATSTVTLRTRAGKAVASAKGPRTADGTVLVRVPAACRGGGCIVTVQAAAGPERATRSVRAG